MSGIALIFRRDGAPVPRGDLETMTTAMSHRAVDGVHHEIDGSVGVGFCSMVTTPITPAGQQPIRCRGGSTLIAIDGRLDDRATLRARLGGRIPEGACDSELVALAVERWGAGFINNLLGDYAIVVADVANRRVVCARDHLGVKPLYYASIGPLFVAASEVGAVLAHPAVPDDLDPAAFDAWAKHWIVPGATIYRNILPLPMASVVVATANGLVGPSRHWTPRCQPDPGQSPANLVEEYSWLLHQATRDRLRSSGPIVLSMSGGLDSTSLACVVEVLAAADPGLQRVQPASLVYPGHRRIDESDLIGLMEDRLGIPVRRVRPAPRSPADLEAEIRRYRDMPDVPNDQFEALIRPEDGERVLLTGLGGDDWFYASRGSEIARAVRHGRWLTAIRKARLGRDAGDFSSVHDALWRFGLRPLPKMVGAVAARSPTISTGMVSVGGDLAARFLDMSARPAGLSPETAHALSWSRSPLLSERLAVLERRAAHHGFEHRHPLHDLRLVELSLRLPGRFRCLDGDARWLPRRAMAGAIPDDIRLRRTKAEFSLTVREEVVLTQASGVLDRAWAASDDSTGEAAWRQIQATDMDAWHPRLFELWSTAALQIWRETLG